MEFNESAKLGWMQLRPSPLWPVDRYYTGSVLRVSTCVADAVSATGPNQKPRR